MPTAPEGDPDGREDSALRLNSDQLAGQTLADRPDYIAFRIPKGRGLLTVVAVLQPEEGDWKSFVTRKGKFEAVPVDQAVQKELERSTGLTYRGPS